jgi:hypothetical protein
VKSRGEGSMGDSLLDEGAVSTSSGVSGMSGGKGDASGMSTRMGSGTLSKAEGASCFYNKACLLQAMSNGQHQQAGFKWVCTCGVGQ